MYTRTIFLDKIKASISFMGSISMGPVVVSYWIKGKGFFWVNTQKNKFFGAGNRGINSPYYQFLKIPTEDIGGVETELALTVWLKEKLNGTDFIPLMKKKIENLKKEKQKIENFNKFMGGDLYDLSSLISFWEEIERTMGEVTSSTPTIPPERQEGRRPHRPTNWKDEV